MGRLIGRKKDRQIGTYRGRQINKTIDKQINRYICRQIDWQEDRHRDRQIDKQMTVNVFNELKEFKGVWSTLSVSKHHKPVILKNLNYIKIVKK